MRRRALLLALPSCLTVAGCGFAPRGAQRFAFDRLALRGFAPRSPLRAELERQLARTSVRVVELAQAQVVLEMRNERASKTAVVSTAAGQVRDWQVQLDVEYSLASGADEMLLPATQLRLTRDLSTTESQALAKQQEESELRRAMEQEAAALLMRRLAAVRPR